MIYVTYNDKYIFHTIVFSLCLSVLLCIIIIIVFYNYIPRAFEAAKDQAICRVASVPSKQMSHDARRRTSETRPANDTPGSESHLPGRRHAG